MHKVKILIFGKCQKLLDIDNGQRPKHSTYHKAKGISGKIISITFFMTPWNLKCAHQLGLNGPGKIMTPFGLRQKVSDTSISSSLSFCLMSLVSLRPTLPGPTNTIGPSPHRALGLESFRHCTDPLSLMQSTRPFHQLVNGQTIISNSLRAFRVKTVCKVPL